MKMELLSTSKIRKFKLVICFYLIASCSDNNANGDGVKFYTLHAFTRAVNTEVAFSELRKNNILPSHIDFNSQTFGRNKQISYPKSILDSIVRALNDSYQGIRHDKLNTTLYTRFSFIKYSKVLEKQRGITGASEYITTTTKNLTSFRGIRYVHIEMEEHSHSSPGTFGKDDFTSFKEA